jgi:two-component sensor histidine kinase
LEELPISQIIHQTNWEKFEKLCDSSLKVQELMADEFKAISKNKTEFVVKILMRPMIENGEAGGIMAYVWAMEKLKVEKAKIDRLAISRDLIIKELNHRFKNNMVVISSLLALQAKDVTDEKLLSVLKESQNRIRTMTLLHEKLYLTKEMPQLNFAAYIKELATELFHLYNFSPELIKLKMDIAEIELDLDYAVPCGLIINEMISNSLKYAFPTGQKGQIFLKLEPLADEFVLTYGDNGAGLPSDFSFKETTTLGMQIIRLLVEELEGSIELLKDKHTVFQIKFPKLSKAHEG